MKKVFLLAIIVIVALMSACATPADQFEADKNRIHAVEGAESLNITFRNALEDNSDFDKEISDSFVTISYFRGSPCCEFNVLTKDGEYLSFNVNDAERLYLMYCPQVPPQDRIGGHLGRYELVDWNGHTGTIQRHKNQ